MKLNKSHAFQAFVFAAIATFLNVGASSVTRAGTLIGNGDGIVEQNCFYAYTAIPKAIDSCLSAADVCGVSPDDMILLKRIKAIVLQYPATSQRILFTSDSARPSFFETGLGQAHRVAQTGFIPTVPIYFNTDQFYNVNGTPALDLPILTSILIHELGHQAGIVEHAYLDQLGSRIRNWLMNRTFELGYHYPNSSLKVLSINYANQNSTPDLYFVDDKGSSSLVKVLTPVARCTDPTEILIGWSVTNLHWDSQLNLSGSSGLFSTSKTGSLALGGWLELECVRNGRLEVEHPAFDLILGLKDVGGTVRFSDATLH